LGYTAADIRQLSPLVKPYADALELSTHYVGNDISPITQALEAAKAAVDVPQDKKKLEVLLILILEKEKEMKCRIHRINCKNYRC
jgi:hypothetical protein